MAWAQASISSAVSRPGMRSASSAPALIGPTVRAPSRGDTARMRHDTRIAHPVRPHG